MKKVIRQLILLCLPLALPAAAEEAPTGDAQAEGKRCISMSRISSAEIIDDRTIAFHMTGRDIYLNELPRRCPGMHFGRGISYRTHSGQLCNLDTITVLNGFGGVRGGPTCGLGHFQPISKDALKALKAERRKGKDNAQGEAQEETQDAEE